MKKALLSFVLLTFIGLAAFSQSIVLKKEDGTVISNANRVDSVFGTGAISVKYKFFNISSSAHDYILKKIDKVMVPGTKSGFCWDVCSDVATVSGKLNIGAGDSTTAFSGDYFSENIVGSSTVRFVFYNKADVTDSNYVDVVFTVNEVSVNENLPAFTLSNPFPNPANEYVAFKYAVNKPFNQASVKIFDLLGNKVAEKEISESLGVLSINTSNLNNGIYFYSIVIDEKPFLSRKMVVKH
ncbi:MAG: T9SS type A sorting domain-containing protein [Bacteroidota bacterium]